MMKHCMIDLETLGIKPGSVILSIGAVQFDPAGGPLGVTFSKNVDIQSCLDAGLTVDGSTIAWWLGQGDAARAEVCKPGDTLVTALTQLTDYLLRNGIDIVWSNGSGFDIVLLEAAYRQAGLPIPWSYRAARDMRTIMDLSGIKTRTKYGTQHSALDDAIAQAKDVMRAYKEFI